MPLDQLLAALQRDARAAADAITADAAREAERIVAAADAEVAAQRDAATRAALARARAVADQSVSEAARAVRREVLVARDAMLERVFAAAVARLPEALGRADYLASLDARVAEALRCVGDAPAVVRASPQLEQPLRALRSAQPRLSLEVDRDGNAGFVLIANDGSVTVEDTLQSRMRRDRPSLARLALGAVDAA